MTVPSPRHAAVASDQSLIADSVAAALSAPTLRTTRIAWRRMAEPRVPQPRRDEPFDVGVLLSELLPDTRLAEAQALVREVAVPWVLLTDAPQGPSWGAMIEAGVVAILPSSCSLDEVRGVIERAAAGETLLDDAEAAALRDAWRVEDRRRRQTLEQVGSLTERELAVLARLHEGESVAQIARRFAVAPATVRSQVRSILRKLEVRTQLAAVALYAASQDEPDPGLGAARRHDTEE